MKWIKCSELIEKNIQPANPHRTYLLHDVNGEGILQREQSLVMLLSLLLFVGFHLHFRHADVVGNELLEFVEIEAAAAVAIDGVKTTAQLVAVHVTLTRFLLGGGEYA